VAVLAGVGVVLALLPWGVPGRYAGLALLVPALAWPPQRLPVGEARIDVLDVGQGLAVVVRTARHTLIYDPGPLYGPESDAGQRVVVPYLRHEGVARIDMMVVTHRDSDHAGGAASVLSALPVDEVRSSVAGMAGTRCLAGQRWQWDGVLFTVLHPADPVPTVNLKSNHLSCVLRISTGERHVLLTSDIEAEDEARLLQAWPSALPADVLLVPHHGSRTSSTPAFLSAVGARDVVFPVGYRNRFGHPAPTVLARHAALGSRLWRTDADGGVRIHLSPGAVRLTGARAERARYWHGR
jgi:competence protein ComEC